MSLCSRCFGLYLFLIIGFLISIIFNISLTKSQTLLLTLIFVSPLIFDSVTQFFRLRESNNPLRFITGSLAGLVCGVALHYLIF